VLAWYFWRQDGGAHEPGQYARYAVVQAISGRDLPGVKSYTDVFDRLACWGGAGMDGTPEGRSRPPEAPGEGEAWDPFLSAPGRPPGRGPPGRRPGPAGAPGRSPPARGCPPAPSASSAAAWPRSCWPRSRPRGQGRGTPSAPNRTNERDTPCSATTTSSTA